MRHRVFQTADKLDENQVCLSFMKRYANSNDDLTPGTASRAVRKPPQALRLRGSLDALFPQESRTFRGNDFVLKFQVKPFVYKSNPHMAHRVFNEEGQSGHLFIIGLFLLFPLIGHHLTRPKEHGGQGGRRIAGTRNGRTMNVSINTPRAVMSPN